MRSEKLCQACGRQIEWRKKWERDWEQVRYCSKSCRSQKVSAQDRELERAILDRLRQRAVGASLCPSEVARSVSPEDWRPLLEPTRRAARRLVAQGRVEITQQGHVVDPSTAKGPIRIRLA